MQCFVTTQQVLVRRRANTLEIVELNHLDAFGAPGGVNLAIDRGLQDSRLILIHVLLLDC